MTNITQSTMECNNNSPIIVNGSEVTCKVFVYIKEHDDDVLAVNNRVVANTDENGDIKVVSLKVIEAFDRTGDKEALLKDFSWSDVPAIEKLIADYLKQELENNH